MTKVDVTVSVPAAAKNLVDGLLKVVADLKAGKGWIAVASDAEPVIVDAVKNLSELESEVSDPQLAVLGGMFVGQLVNVLRGTPAPADETVPAPAPAPAP